MTSHEFTKVALKQMEGLLEGALMNGRSEGLGYAAGLLRTVAAGGAEVALDGFDVAQAQQVLAAYRAAAEAFHERESKNWKLVVLAAGVLLAKINGEQEKDGWAAARATEEYMGLEKALVEMNKNPGEGEAG